MKIILAILFCATSLYSQEDTFWEYLAYPYGGTIEDLAIEQGDYLYACCLNGIFKSTDFGDKWIQVQKGPNLQIISGNHKKVVLSIASKYFYNYRSARPFLIRTTDRGKTWDTLHTLWYWLNPEQMKQDHRFFISKIAFDDNDMLYASVNFNKESSDYKGYSKLLKSEDYGESWTIIEEYKYTGAVGDTNIYNFWTYKNGLIAMVRHIHIPKPEYERYEFVISRDTGRTWVEYPIVDLSEYENEIDNVIFLNDSNFYLQSASIFKSSDYGYTWVDLKFPFKTIWRILILNPKNIFMNTREGLVFTSNGGESWETRHQYSVSLNNLLGHLYKDSKGNIYSSASLQGFNRSTDGGYTFESMKNGFINYISLGGLTFDKSGNVYLGYDGVYRSSDHGISWEHHRIDSLRFDKLFCLNDGSILAYGGASDKFKLYISKDEGKSWEFLCNTGFPILYIGQNSKGTLFASSSSSFIFQSNDNGKTWEYLEHAEGQFSFINNNDHIFSASGHRTDIWRSTDDGAKWTQLYNQLEDEPGIGCSSSNPYGVSSVFDKRQGIGFVDTDGNGCVVRTLDNGETWKSQFRKAKWNYNDGSVWTAKWAFDSLGNLWAGTFRSTDAGDNWYSFEKGFDINHYYIVSAEVSPDGYIYLMSLPGGLYRSREAYVSVRTTERVASELSASPNPFSERTELSFTLTEPGYIRLELYDILGRSLSTLSSGWYDAGTQRIALSSDGIPTGMYYVLLANGNERQIQKIFLIK